MHDVMGFLACRLDLYIFHSSPPGTAHTWYQAYIRCDNYSLRVHYWRRQWRVRVEIEIRNLLLRNNEYKFT